MKDCCYMCKKLRTVRGLNYQSSCSDERISNLSFTNIEDTKKAVCDLFDLRETIQDKPDYNIKKVAQD